MTDNSFNPKTKKSLGTLVSELPGQLSTLARAEVDAFKSEMSGKAKNFGVGIGLFVAAAVLLFFSTGVFIALAVIAIALALPLWLSALIVAVALLLIAVILALIGLNRVKVASAKDPDGLGASIRHDVDAIKGVGNYEH